MPSLTCGEEFRKIFHAALQEIVEYGIQLSYMVDLSGLCRYQKYT